MCIHFLDASLSIWTIVRLNWSMIEYGLVHLDSKVFAFGVNQRYMADWPSSHSLGCCARWLFVSSWACWMAGSQVVFHLLKWLILVATYNSSQFKSDFQLFLMTLWWCDAYTPFVPMTGDGKEYAVAALFLKPAAVLWPLPLWSVDLGQSQWSGESWTYKWFPTTVSLQ